MIRPVEVAVVRCACQGVGCRTSRMVGHLAIQGSYRAAVVHHFGGIG